MIRFVLVTVLVALLLRAFWRLAGGIIAGSVQPRSGGVPQRGARMVRDPVCGTFVLPGRALTVTDHGRPVFFCSATCRDAYQARTA
jgi:YHS domain-containing protein